MKCENWIGRVARASAPKIIAGSSSGRSWSCLVRPTKRALRAKFLLRCGCKVVKQNFKAVVAEMDPIALNADTLGVHRSEGAKRIARRFHPRGSRWAQAASMRKQAESLSVAAPCAIGRCDPT